MELNGVKKVTIMTRNCGESLFNAISYLMNGEFDTQSLRLYIAKTFCNSTKGSSTNIPSYIKHVLEENMLQTMPRLMNCKLSKWQSHMWKEKLKEDHSVCNG